MGGSVGIGALIVGVSLLAVFTIATSAIEAQMQSSLETVDQAGEPIPSLRIDNAMDETDAISSVTITNAGATYAAGTLVVTGGTGCCFSGSYSVTAGAITGITIQDHGAWTVTPTLTPSDAGDGNAVLTANIGTVVYANITNDGKTTIDLTKVWLSLDGGEPLRLSSLVSTPAHLFPAESVSVVYAEGSSTDFSRLSFNAMSATTTIGI